VPRRLCAALLAALAFGWTDAAAAPGDPPPAADASIEQQETDARAKASDEMANLARFCTSKAAIDEARRAYGNALELNARNAAAVSELDKLKAKKNAPRAGVADLVADRRGKSLATCVELLSPVVLACNRAGRSADLDRIVTLLRGMDAPVANLDVAFFEPYLTWHSKKEVEILQSGGECVDGAWLDAAKVAELDRAHASWSDPWSVSDDVHEVRTTQSLRIARQALIRIAAARSVFLSYFQGQWDLRPAPVKLRVFVTGNHEELDGRAA
jgi:hypothetical protein